MLPRCNSRFAGAVLAFGLALLLADSRPAHAQFEDVFGQSPLEDSADDASSVIDVLEDAKVLDELRLDNSQRTRIATLVADFRRQATQLEQAQANRLAGLTSIGERLRKRAEFLAETRSKTAELRQQAERSLLEILNPEQQALLKAKLPPSAPGTSDTLSIDSSSGSTPANETLARPATRSEDAVASFSSGDAAPTDNAPAAGAPQTGQGRLSFNFHGAPWTDVLRLFADAAGLTLNLKDTPPGEFSYYDSQEYTPTQALDIMNRFLLQDGYILVHHDRFLTVLDTKKGIPPNLIDTVTPDELSQRGATELVRVALPLGDREAAKAAEEIRALLGPQGQVAPLESAGSVVVTDIAANLLRVKQLLEPPPKVQAAEMIFRAFPLTQIDAPTAADIVRSLFGLQGGIRNVSSAAEEALSGRSSRSSRGGFDPREFWRRGGGENDNDSDRDRDSRGSQPTATQSNAKVAIDARTNSVLVTATAAEMKIVEGIIEAIDVAPDEASSTLAQSLRDTNAPYLEVYELQDADAQEVAKTLSVLHPGMVVNEDGRNRRIHIFAPADRQAEIAAHIRQLDGAASGEVLAILPIDELNPYDVTATLTALYGAQDSDEAPAIQLDPSGRGIVVRATIVQLSQIRMLIEQMVAQGPSPTQRAVRVVPIGSQSTFVTQAIGSLYPQVSISTTAVPAPAVTSTSSSRGSSSPDRNDNIDDDRADRYRRFMEFRERFFGGSGSSDGDRGRDGDRDRGRDRGRDRDND